VQYSPDNVWSYLEYFYEYSFKNLDLLYEEYYQTPLCSDLDKSKEIVCPGKDPCENFLQQPMITLLCCVSRGVVGRYVFCIEFPLGKNLESKGWLNTSRKSFPSQFLNFPLRICQSSTRSFSIPSQALDYEDVLGSHLYYLMSHFFEPLTFHDPFLKWIENFPQRVT